VIFTCIVYLVISVLALCDQKCRKTKFELWNALFWNASLRIFIEGYLPTVY
jgi:hypothetical protein